MRFLLYWLGGSLLLGGVYYFSLVDTWSWLSDVAWRCGTAATFTVGVTLWAGRQARQIAALPVVQRHAARYRFRFWVTLQWFMVAMAGPLSQWLLNGVSGLAEIWPATLTGLIFGGVIAEYDWRKLCAASKENA